MKWFGRAFAVGAGVSAGWILGEVLATATLKVALNLTEPFATNTNENDSSERV